MTSPMDIRGNLLETGIHEARGAGVDDQLVEQTIRDPELDSLGRKWIRRIHESQDHYGC